MTAPVVVSCGYGTNSAAMLIGMVEQQERVDLILFADTGGERPETYRFGRQLSDWLTDKGYPAIEEVYYTDKHGERVTLEGRSLETERLPSLAYGFKKCSMRFKRDPQNKRVNNWQPARDCWAAGGLVTKVIGFDADEPHRASRIGATDSKYRFRYPLLEWNWGRDECVEAIKRAGLPQPGKSSCFFCPAMRPREILSLKQCHPDLLERALAIERAAAPHCKGSIIGLGRDWKWEDLIDADERQQKLFRQPIEQMCGCYDG
jgi:hypothetical protein